jgi:predicted  nucleic acid-binding Zn-ribbon protein
LELLEGKIEKYKDQLMQVKTNDEYKAMQKQVETAKVEVSDKEDKILVKMEEAEQLQEELKRRKKELDEGVVRVKKMEAELEAEATRLRQELEGKNNQRKQTVDSLPKDLITQYDEIGRVRSGIAIAQAKDEHCQVCHVRLRPQVYSELRIGNKILRCENCSRILYYLEPASA